MKNLIMKERPSFRFQEDRQSGGAGGKKKPLCHHKVSICRQEKKDKGCTSFEEEEDICHCRDNVSWETPQPANVSWETPQPAKKTVYHPPEPLIGVYEGADVRPVVGSIAAASAPPWISSSRGPPNFRLNISLSSSCRPANRRAVA